MTGFGIVLCFLILGIFEAGLILTGTGTPDDYEDPFVGFEPGHDLFEPQTDEDGVTVRVTRKSKLRFFNEQRFTDPKPADTFRIFALGGSTTYGHPYEHPTSFSSWLGLLLPEMAPSRNYEVVNAGGISYASYRIVVLMKELIRYQPDLFVVYTGHNEFLEERTYGEIMDDGPLLRAFKEGFNRLRTVTVMKQALAKWRQEADSPGGGLPAEVKAKLDVWDGLESFTRNDSLQRFILKHFRFNIQQMINLARDHDVDILFINPASNIKDFSPFKSQHAPPLTPEKLERFEVLLGQAMTEMEKERYAEALAALEAAVKLSPDYAEVHYRMGRCYLGLGDFEKAEKHLTQAKELDVCPLRALEEINASILETARRNRVPVIDLPAILEEDSLARYGHGLIGKEYFLDHVHPRIEVHQHLAERIADTLAKEGLVPMENPLAADRRQALYDDFLENLDPSYYAKRDFNLGKVLGWAGKYEEAAAALERASELLPNEPMVHYNLGIAYQKLGRAEPAIERYWKVVQLAPGFSEAHFNLGKCYQMSGDFPTAATAFQKVLELTPGDGKAHYNLALCYRELGRYEDERMELEKAREADPAIPDIDRLLGSVYQREGFAYGQKGQLDEAIVAFARAIELEPDSGKAHYHLASLYAARRNRDLAIAHFGKAKELGVDVPDAVFQELEAELK